MYQWPPIIDQYVYGIDILANVFRVEYYDGIDLSQVFATRELAEEQRDRDRQMYLLNVSNNYSILIKNAGEDNVDIK